MPRLCVYANRQRILIAVFLIFAVASGITACAPSSKSEGPEELVYGLTLVPSGIDPHIHASGELGIPLRSVYDTLVYRDAETMEFVPGLARSWDISEDGLTYTFHLRNDVTFHDGTAFNAEAVRINLERILAPDTNSLKAAQLLGPVMDVQAPDAETVIIILNEPFAPLLDGLSQPYLGIASPAALAEYDDATYQFHQVGTGPYRFVEYIVNDRLVLEANPDYDWGPSTVTNQGPPAIQRIVFRFYTDPAARSLALQSGEVQIMGELLPGDAQQLVADGTIKTEVVPIPGQPAEYFLNTNYAPTSSPAVRQALLLATDRQAIVQTVFAGYSSPSYGPLADSSLFYSSAVEDRYAYDPAQAVALMDSTGWLDSDGDGWRDDGTEPLEIVLVTPPWGLLPEVSQLLESQWEATLDTQVRIREVASFTMLSEAAGEGKYNAISVHFSGLDPIVLNAFYLSDGSLNWTRNVDPELDDLLLSAESAVDDNARADLYAQAQARILDDALLVPIRNQVNINGYSPTVSGLHYDAQGWFPYLTDLTFTAVEQ